MAKAGNNPIPFIVVLQTPAYGTLTWGPFVNRAAATEFIHGGELNNHIINTYEQAPAGMVVWEQPLYSATKNGGE
jgi:hypothetical protein